MYSADLDIINHPVHIVTKDNTVSPSAFIPFCDFGGNMSAMGVQINTEYREEYRVNFSDPVCNSFQAKILNDQLCYEVDLQKFSDVNNIHGELKLGFNFLLDYNEDRQVTLDQVIHKKSFSLANSFDESDRGHHAIVYLDTIGIYDMKILKSFRFSNLSYF